MIEFQRITSYVYLLGLLIVFVALCGSPKHLRTCAIQNHPSNSFLSKDLSLN